MSVARNILKNPKLGPAGGATQLTVSATLKQKSSSVEGIEKWPYEAAAIACERIPRTLAPNCRHANGEKSWLAIDGSTGVITGVKEKKIGGYLFGLLLLLSFISFAISIFKFVG
ncbi:hypothetical protein L3X38_012015 [Prunus dulcis]|uniref:Uncharacterized protein n=1 Tax=Prunus dulcis TaxID=3755 RepID=A0AAD4ZG85_PRUDU|nr:hypothetical protein L3X38_012015 [Prunus dulcis]